MITIYACRPLWSQLTPRASYQAHSMGPGIPSHNDGMTLTWLLELQCTVGDQASSDSTKAQQGTLTPEEIDEDSISHALTTADYPDPDLLIRTSGEQWLSNFTMANVFIIEFYFTSVFGLILTKSRIWKAIYDYQQRERRFGMTSAQLVSDQKTGLKSMLATCLTHSWSIISYRLIQIISTGIIYTWLWQDYFCSV